MLGIINWNFNILWLVGWQIIITFDNGKILEFANIKDKKVYGSYICTS